MALPTEQRRLFMETLSGTVATLLETKKLGSQLPNEPGWKDKWMSRGEGA